MNEMDKVKKQPVIEYHNIKDHLPIRDKIQNKLLKLDHYPLSSEHVRGLALSLQQLGIKRLHLNNSGHNLSPLISTSIKELKSIVLRNSILTQQDLFVILQRKVPY